MKYRWLKISSGDMIWGTNDLKIEDLANRKRGVYEAILDTQEGTYYDPEANDWIPIDGDKQ